MPVSSGTRPISLRYTRTGSALPRTGAVGADARGLDQLEAAALAVVLGGQVDAAERIGEHLVDVDRGVALGLGLELGGGRSAGSTSSSSVMPCSARSLRIASSSSSKRSTSISTTSHTSACVTVSAAVVLGPLDELVPGRGVGGGKSGHVVHASSSPRLREPR